ncbi:MAG TPA: tetratricopeptide repeat-containing sensor histidine kinase, partial [Bacteroidales bacterium]|nr:tetratricopeptide repeat-containing sensor histidine kinase [Bacteroidales bacterium]
YRDIASSLNNIGNVYQSVNDYTKAREYYSRSYNMADKNDFRLVAAITSNNIGDLLLMQNKYDSALVYFNRSLKISASLGSKFYQGIALFNIGNIYLQNDSTEAARLFLDESLTRAMEAGDRLGIAECYLKLGELFLKKSEPHTAEPFLDSGMLMAGQIGSLKLLDLANKLKTDYYSQLSDFPAAYKTMEKRLALKDSIFNQESGENIAKLEARYREEKRMQQIADLRKEKINNRNIYIVGTLSLLIILILIFLGLRTSRRKNAILSSQNEEIEKQRLLLIQKNRELVKSQTELEKINQGKDQFLTIISHDLRNPVSATRGFVELLINRFDQLSDPDKKRFLQEVFDSVERISLLISNILFWVRTQTSGIRIQPVEFDLHKRINDNFSLYQIIAKGKGVNLINDVPLNFLITGDTNIYDTIFRNLISNSLKFTEAGGDIKFEAVRTNGKLVISIHDTGIGFDPLKTNDILSSEIHYSTTGTQHEKGTGLGLSLINEFAHNLDASLNIKSTPGQGTTVSLTTAISS